MTPFIFFAILHWLHATASATEDDDKATIGIDDPFYIGTDFLACGFDRLVYWDKSDGAITESAAAASKSSILDLRNTNFAKPAQYNGKTYWLSDRTLVKPGTGRYSYNATQFTSYYNEYYHEYIEYVTITDGIATPLGKAGFAWHKELVDVDATLSTGTSYAASSKDIWVVYFLEINGVASWMPWSSVFTDALTHLVPQPVDEYDQQDYCMVLAAFGTDYIQSVGLGGKVKSAASTSSSFVSKYSYEYTMKQFGFYAEYNRARMTYGGDWEYWYKQMNEEFFSAAEAMFYFEPAVWEDPTQPTKKMMDLWVDKSISEPVVIAFVIAPIYNLLGSNHEFRSLSAHYKVTSDFYVQHGHCPTLKELNGKE